MFAPEQNEINEFLKLVLNVLPPLDASVSFEIRFAFFKFMKQVLYTRVI